MTTSFRLLARRASLLVLLFVTAMASASAQAPGKLVVSHDEWPLTDTGFSLAPDTPRYVDNLARWFVGDQAGNFLAYSNNAGLNGATLAGTMAALGHTWTVDDTAPFDLPTLLTYDAVFLCGAVQTWDDAVMISYVQAGGHVYLALGFSGVDLTYAPLMQAFGMDMDAGFNPLVGSLPITSAHPLFFGVDELYVKNGRNVFDLDPANCDTQIIGTVSGFDCYSTLQSRQRLTMTLDERTVTTGDAVTLDVRSGPTGVPMLLALVDVSGIAFFHIIDFSSFGAQCSYVLPFTVPSGLSGLTVSFRAFSTGGPGGIFSNVETLTVQ